MVYIQCKRNRGKQCATYLKFWRYMKDHKDKRGRSKIKENNNRKLWSHDQPYPKIAWHMNNISAMQHHFGAILRTCKMTFF